jgi:branched-chain amino acid transport system ATP-binding protein
MTAPNNGISLSVEGLSLRFGGLLAVADMTFNVKEGEVLSLIGPNGAGKTSAFNAITGYLQPSKGVVLYRGNSLVGRSPNEIAELGVVRTFQKTSVFGGQTVLDNILIGLHRSSKQRAWEIMLGLPRVKREERLLRDEAWEVLKFIGLKARVEELGSALPYGDQRLLEVAVALAAKPSLLLLDEPVSGMNPVETESFMKILAKIRDLKITVLLVEHDMRMVMGVSDRIIVLNQGIIIADGTPVEIRGNPEVIKAYLGERYSRAEG